MRKRWRDLDTETIAYLAECKRRKRGVLSPAEQRVAAAQRQVDAFNAAHPVGVPVRYWPWTREGEGIASRTRTPAQRIGGSEGQTASVWVEGRPDCISLTHVEALRSVEASCHSDL